MAVGRTLMLIFIAIGTTFSRVCILKLKDFFVEVVIDFQYFSK